MLCLSDSIRHDDPQVQRCLARLKRPTHSQSWSWRYGPWRVSLPYTLSNLCWPNAPVARPLGPAAGNVGHACAVKLCEAPGPQPRWPSVAATGRTVSPGVRDTPGSSLG